MYALKQKDSDEGKEIETEFVEDDDPRTQSV